MATPSVYNLKLIIDGSNTGAIKALSQLTAESQKTGASLSHLDSAVGNFDKSKAGITQLTGQLSSLQMAAKSFAATAGLSIGVVGIVQLADAYSQMTSRLQLATQYSGDFTQVQGMLRDSARATRSDLQGTVDLYAKMSPALKGIGLNAQQSVGILTTINQAITLSGASAQAASAALMQLGQGFGSGVLRGEELNSVMEQTPALAMAIADGLGVPLGALRKLGEEGKLTAESVALALQKMAPQLAEDFAKMPVTVSQALVALKNEFLVYVGATDQATGSTSALANIIGVVATEFAEAGPVVTTFTVAIKTMANGLDGAYRLLKIMALGLAGYAAAAAAALSGDFSGAKRILAEMGADVSAVLEKRLATEGKAVNAAADGTKKRALLEEQLAFQTKRLAEARLFVETGALDKIAGKEKESVDARIADQKRLVDAVRTSWKESLAEAEKYAEAAKAKLAKATDIRDQGKTSAFNASIAGLSPEDQVTAKSDRLTELKSQGDYEAAVARNAAMEGNAKKYEAAAGAAEKKLKEALQLAQDVKDVTAIEDISNSLAKVQESGAGLDQKKAAEAQARAATQAELLNALQAKLDELTKQARTIEVKADITDAETKIKGIQNQLNDLAKGIVIPATIATNGAPANPAAGLPMLEPYLPTRAYGGPLPGSAPHDRADNVIYRGTPGEFLIQRPTVKQAGALAFLHDFNRRGMAAVNDWKIPGHAFGGEIGGSAINRLAVPQLPSRASQANESLYGNFYLDANRYEMKASRSTFEDLANHLSRQALKKGGRR